MIDDRSCSWIGKAEEATMFAVASKRGFGYSEASNRDQIVSVLSGPCLGISRRSKSLALSNSQGALSISLCHLGSTFKFYLGFLRPSQHRDSDISSQRKFWTLLWSSTAPESDFMPIIRARGMLDRHRLWITINTGVRYVPRLWWAVQDRRVVSPIITLGALLCSPVPRVTTTRVSITLGNFQSRLI